jgi:hypothetical protein
MTHDGGSQAHAWDTITGLEVFTLKSGRGSYMSPDGHRLVHSNEIGRVHRDLRPETPEMRSRRVASVRLRSLLERAVAGGHIPERQELVEQVRNDSVLGPEARRIALALVDDFRNAFVLREADRRVAALLAEPMGRDEAASSLRANTLLDEQVRQVALGLTRRYTVDVWALWWAVEKVFLQPHATEADYERALRWAEDGLASIHGSSFLEGMFLNAIGLFQYRLGRLDRAKATLERSAQLNLRNEFFTAKTDAFDNVVLAMVVHKMGDKEGARRYLHQIREASKHQRNYALVIKDPLFIPRMKEAEALIEPRVKELPDDVFAPVAVPAAPTSHNR